MSSAFILERPTSYSANIIDQDGLWKKVIADLFEDFLLFFAPELVKEIDLTRAPDFLQQELFKEIMVNKKGKNYADQIVKVHLKDGEEKWILIHIEVQGEEGEPFPERMFRYFYRIYDKYKHEIVAFAVLTGSEESDKPTMFNYSYFGTKLHYEYNVMKVRDYDNKELEQSTRLFSKVVLAANYLNETKNDTERRYAFKMKLMREIIKMNDQPRESIRAIFYFIDYLLQLPEALSKELGETILPLLRKAETRMLQSEKWEKSPTLAEAFAIEWNEGKEKGKLEERRNLALALLHKDFSDEEISELTKLDLIEVNNLRKTSE